MLKICVLFIVFFSIEVLGEVLHLELGAANYGAEALSSDARDLRFKVLTRTVEELVETYGVRGIIYLSDVDLSGLTYAEHYLKDWLQEKGLLELKVESLPGDYRLISLPRVTTMYLNNPMLAQMPALPDSNQVLRTEQKFTHPRKTDPTFREHNEFVADDLVRLARLSETGIRVDTIFYEGINYLVANRAHQVDVEYVGTGQGYNGKNGEFFAYEETPMVFNLRAVKVIDISTHISCKSFL